MCGLGFEYHDVNSLVGRVKGLLQRMDEGQAGTNKTKQVVEITQHTMDALPVCGRHTFCSADSPVPPPTPLLSVVCRLFVFLFVNAGYHASTCET